jgi:hypothetical protein
MNCAPSLVAAFNVSETAGQLNPSAKALIKWRAPRMLLWMSPLTVSPLTVQLPLFTDPAQELIKALAGTSLDQMSPVQAFDLLRAWKAKFTAES